MKKRILGLVIIIMLILVCVCFCSKHASDKSTGATAETTNAPTPESTETPEPTETPTPEPTEPPHEHAYTEAITTEATCEADGLKTFTCECGDTYTEAIPATGHIFENYVSNNDATYTSDGTETAKCNTCDLTDTRTAEGSKLEYTYTEMNATMYATQTVNVRNLPSTDGEKIGSLSTNQEITVLGQCNETSWYKFELDGQTAFVSNSYLSTEKVEVQQAPPADNGGAVSGVPNPFTVERNVVHDMGTYQFVVSSYYDYNSRELLDPYGGSAGHHLNTSEDLWCWVSYDDPWDPALQAFIQAYICHCGGADHKGLYPERLGN